mmetsp:Transcript_139272/g.338320  ORF Transcript_139272/g.338320 Transcript_139272/m.338320 type:complete len:211 (+) Transcript_139272:474-1106(+)
MRSLHADQHLQTPASRTMYQGHWGPALHMDECSLAPAARARSAASGSTQQTNCMRLLQAQQGIAQALVLGVSRRRSADTCLYVWGMPHNLQRSPNGASPCDQQQRGHPLPLQPRLHLHHRALAWRQVASDWQPCPMYHSATLFVMLLAGTPERPARAQERSALRQLRGGGCQGYPQRRQTDVQITEKEQRNSSLLCGRPADSAGALCDQS